MDLLIYTHYLGRGERKFLKDETYMYVKPLLFLKITGAPLPSILNLNDDSLPYSFEYCSVKWYM